jgi:hypothetical protein
MKFVAFIADYQAIDTIIDHLMLPLVAEKPPPSHVFEQVALAVDVGVGGAGVGPEVVFWNQ